MGVPSQLDRDTVLLALKPLLEDPSVLKVAQNAKYDMAVLSRYGVQVGPIDDTMLISFALEGGLHKSHGMDELSKRLLDHEPISFKKVAGMRMGEFICTNNRHFTNDLNK